MKLTVTIHAERMDSIWIFVAVGKFQGTELITLEKGVRWSQWIMQWLLKAQVKGSGDNLSSLKFLSLHHSLPVWNIPPNIFWCGENRICYDTDSCWCVLCCFVLQKHLYAPQKMIFKRFHRRWSALEKHLSSLSVPWIQLVIDMEMLIGDAVGVFIG